MAQVNVLSGTTSGVPNWSEEVVRIMQELPETGVFLTGIEGSDPWINGCRRNQMQEAHNFYINYEQRLASIHALGITYLRFGLPYSFVHRGIDDYDFSVSDKVVTQSQVLGITILADLLHFGLPDWLHADSPGTPYFQNPNFPMHFARYTRAFAKRYPSVRYYTIVNEPFVTAYLSAKLGLWNEHRTSHWADDRDYVTAVKNIAKAAILGRHAIESVWEEEARPGSPVFIQNESFERAMAEPGSGREAEAACFNLRRFAPLDLIFGRQDLAMRDYLLGQGLGAHEYDWFMTHGSDATTLLGIDHYPSCIHTLTRDAVIDHEPHQPYCLAEVVRDYWQRYPLALLHTEVNAWPQYAEQMCQATYESLCQLRQEGYPVAGMGWYGDDLQIGWHVAMCGPLAFDESPVGLFHKGNPQPVAKQFQSLLEQGFPPYTFDGAAIRFASSVEVAR